MGVSQSEWDRRNPENLAARKKRYNESPKGRAARAASRPAYDAANREELNRKQRAYLDADPRRRLLTSCKARAKAKGLECTIVLDDIEIPERCPALGTLLAVGVKKVGPNSPTLDRIDNDKGYVKGNVCVISFRANTIKGNNRADQLEAVARWMRGMRG